MKAAAAETESLAIRALSEAAAELSSKAGQFDSHLLNVLLEHLGHEEKRVRLLDQESDTCADIMTKHKAEIDLMGVMDRPLTSVLDVAEQRHLCQTSAAADAALKACAGFARDFGPFLSRNPEAQGRLQKLEADHAEVIRKLTPCRDLLGAKQGQIPPAAPATQVTYPQIGQTGQPQVERTSAYPSKGAEEQSGSGSRDAAMQMQPTQLSANQTPAAHNHQPAQPSEALHESQEPKASQPAEMPQPAVLGPALVPSVQLAADQRAQTPTLQATPAAQAAASAQTAPPRAAAAETPTVAEATGSGLEPT